MTLVLRILPDIGLGVAPCITVGCWQVAELGLSLHS